MAIATKTQEIPKARDESKTYIHRTKRNCCLGNESILHGYLYMYLSSFKKNMTLQLFFVKSEVCSQKRLTWVKNRILSFRSRYQILTMARENVGKSGSFSGEFTRMTKAQENIKRNSIQGPRLRRL